jgi:predicted peroxiredoxin
MQGKEERAMESRQPEGRREEMNRSEFLKTLGMGAGALGLAAVMGGTALAEEKGEKKVKYIVAITNGGNNPNRAILGLLAAYTALDKGFGEVTVWLTLEGAELAHKGKADKIDSPIFKKFGSAAELIKKLKDGGASFGVCPPCAEYAGAVAGDKYDFVEKKGTDWLMKALTDSHVAWM